MFSQDRANPGFEKSVVNGLVGGGKQAGEDQIHG
jgi:hypothetical protein